MKRVCIIVDCDDDRPDLLIEACAINCAVQMGGMLRSAYIDERPHRTWLSHFLGIRPTHRLELYPQRIEDADDQMAERAT